MSKKLGKYVDEVREEELAGDSASVEESGVHRTTARDLALAYLGLDEPAQAKKWSAVAGRGYLEIGRMKADYQFDPSDPTDILTGNVWMKALYSLELATLAEDRETLLAAAEEAVSWASLPFLSEIRGREKTLVMDAVAGLGAFICDQSHATHFDTLRSHLEGYEKRKCHRFRGLMFAVEGIATGDVARVNAGCEKIDTFHRTVRKDAPDASVPMAEVNIDACFCVVLARRNGVDVRYSSEYVPETLVDHYPLDD